GPRGAARTVKSAAKAQPVPPKVIAKSSAPKPKSTKAGGQAVSGPTRGGIPKNSLPKLGAKAPRVSQAPTRPPSIPSNLHRENPHPENLDREEADAMQSRAKVAASVARVQAVEKGVRAAHVGRSQQAAPAGSVAVMRQQPRVAQMAQLRAPQAHALRALIADRTRLREAFLLGEVLGVPGGVGARSQR
ncbi:MAG: hypothetical protein QM516_03045, partial [Limnohabitans sp.]|nr:hypothetical protein [Limnohabitans sp.]